MAIANDRSLHPLQAGQAADITTDSLLALHSVPASQQCRLEALLFSPQRWTAERLNTLAPDALRELMRQSLGR